METDFRYILQPVEAAQEGFLLHVCLSFHSHTLLVCKNNTYSVGTEARCKSNWFHWKVDKKRWLVAEGFLPSLTAPGLITVPLRLEAFPVSTGHQPLGALAYSTAGWGSAAGRERKELLNGCFLT